MYCSPDHVYFLVLPQERSLLTGSIPTRIASSTRQYGKKYSPFYKTNTENQLFQYCHTMKDNTGSIINRPGIAGAVLQTALSLIHSVTHPLIQNIEDTFKRKPKKLGTWDFDTPPVCHVTLVICHVSHVTCHMSCVMCHMSDVTCHL